MKLVIVYILEECVYMCLCVLATSSRNCLDVNREDLLEEAKGKMYINVREKMTFQVNTEAAEWVTAVMEVLLWTGQGCLDR